MATETVNEDGLLATNQSTSDAYDTTDGCINNNINSLAKLAAGAVVEARLLDPDGSLQGGFKDGPRHAVLETSNASIDDRGSEIENVVLDACEYTRVPKDVEQREVLSDDSEDIPFGGLTIATYESQSQEVEELDKAAEDSDKQGIDGEESVTNGVELTIDDEVDRDRLLFGEPEEVAPPHANDAPKYANVPLSSSSQREANAAVAGFGSQREAVMESLRIGSQSIRSETDISSACTSQREAAGNEYDSDAYLMQYAGDRFESATPLSNSLLELSSAGGKRSAIESGNRTNDPKKARVTNKPDDDTINLADDEDEMDAEDDCVLRTRNSESELRIAPVARNPIPFRVPHSATLLGGLRTANGRAKTSESVPAINVDASGDAGRAKAGLFEKERKPIVSGTVTPVHVNADKPIEISDSDSDTEIEEKSDRMRQSSNRGSTSSSTVFKKPQLNNATSSQREVKTAVRSCSSSQFGSVSSLPSLTNIDPATLTRSILEQQVRVIRDLSKRRVVQQALTKFLSLVKLPAPNDAAASWIREAIDTASRDLFDCLLESNQHAAIIKTLCFLRQSSRMSDKCVECLTKFNSTHKDAILREKQSLLQIVSSELDTVSFSTASLRRLLVILRVLLHANLLEAVWRIITECGSKLIENRMLDIETLDRLVAVSSQTANLDILQSAVRFLTRLPPEVLARVAQQSFANLETTVQRYAPTLSMDVTKLSNASASYRNRRAAAAAAAAANRDPFSVSTEGFNQPSASNSTGELNELYLAERKMASGDSHQMAARPVPTVLFRTYPRINEAKSLAGRKQFDQLASLFTEVVCAPRFDADEYEALSSLLIDTFATFYAKDSSSGLNQVLSATRNFFTHLLHSNTLAVAYDASAKMWFRLIACAVQLRAVPYIRTLYEIGAKCFPASASSAIVPQLNAVYRDVFEKLIHTEPPVIETFLELQKSTPLLNGLIVQPTVIRRLVTHCVNAELESIKKVMQSLKDSAREAGERKGSARRPALYSHSLHFLYEWANKASIYPPVRHLTCESLNDRFVLRVYNDLTAEEIFVVLCEYLSRFYVYPHKNDGTEVMVFVDYVGRQRDKQIHSQPMLIRPDKSVGDFLANDYRLSTVLNLRILLSDSRFVKSEADVRYAIRSMLLVDEQPSLSFLPAKLSFTQPCEPFRSGAVLRNDPMER